MPDTPANSPTPLSAIERCTIAASIACIAFIGITFSESWPFSDTLLLITALVLVGLFSTLWPISLAAKWYLPVKNHMWIAWLFSGLLSCILLFFESVYLMHKLLRVQITSVHEGLIMICGIFSPLAIWFLLRNQRADRVLLYTFIPIALTLFTGIGLLILALRQAAPPGSLILNPSRTINQVLTVLTTSFIQGLPLLVTLLYLRNTGKFGQTPDPQNHCLHCAYNLTGTRAAGHTTCPECGRSLTPDHPVLPQAPST